MDQETLLEGLKKHIEEQCTKFSHSVIINKGNGDTPSLNIFQPDDDTGWQWCAAVVKVVHPNILVLETTSMLVVELTEYKLEDPTSIEQLISKIIQATTKTGEERLQEVAEVWAQNTNIGE